MLRDWWKWLNNKKVTQLMDKGYKRNISKNSWNILKLEIQIELIISICLNNKNISGVVLSNKLRKGKTQFGIIIEIQDTIEEVLENVFGAK